MNQSLAYVREILAGHTENDTIGKKIYDKISNKQYDTERLFVKNLTAEEMYYLNQVLEEAIEYSNQEQDHERSKQLTEVFELLMI
ncbi:sporulation protein [Bacillus sp. CECT 9360]|uniref:sporulation protein n=1 Tax=Bacillus sp. CECT 9360 TaxID=2845821 RepID=UPI001E2D82C6|nr:sporulation protein [Bacillus sp. CECT 9360]CAH0344335.1 Sigma-G-dependent sporulation-specific SASP protein [Bacillus sp. CECT 9360]